MNSCQGRASDFACRALLSLATNANRTRPYTMSLHSSPPINASSLHHLEHRYPSFAEVEIRSSTHDLDRSAESALRLAVLASLVETLGPTLPGTVKTKVAPVLAKWRLVRVLTYMDANIGEPMTLTHLAAAAGLSRMCFARQFRAATGIRPHEYVLRKRIECARKMLTETSDTLVRIALSIGFQTQAHFTTVFKRIVGNTPRRWRREQPNVARYARTASGSL
jgi:AraC-like DNA-binding protein